MQVVVALFNHETVVDRYTFSPYQYHQISTQNARRSVTTTTQLVMNLDPIDLKKNATG